MYNTEKILGTALTYKELGLSDDTTWDYNGLSNNANFFGTQENWNDTLVYKITKLSNYINRSCENENPFFGTSGPVCIITNSKSVQILMDTRSFKHVDSEEETEVVSPARGILRGKVQNRYSLFENDEIEEGAILVCNPRNAISAKITIVNLPEWA